MPQGPTDSSVRYYHGPLLAAAADPRKKQYYMLARLAPAQLERLWFPLAELEKPEVRRLAEAAGLSVAKKPESQDLCFLAGVKRTDLLDRLRKTTPKRGEVVTTDGRVLARHDGLDRFTVGQRRGIGAAAG